MSFICINSTKNTVLAQQLSIADTFWSRLRGLLGTASLPGGRGLLISPCSSIHMFGMRYSIDVVFLDKEWRVLKILPFLPPGATGRCSGSTYVLELPVGTLAATSTAVGDELMIKKQ